MKFNRGDTLIEVLFGVTVFALISVTSMGLMNKGTSMTMRSLELVQARQELDSQVAIIRLANLDYINKAFNHTGDVNTGMSKRWAELRVKAKKASAPSITEEKGSVVKCNTTLNILPFRYNNGELAVANSFKDPQTYAKINDDGQSEGIRIYVEDAGSDSSGNLYNVHVYACWNGPDGNIASEKTVLRLYDVDV